jgi:hypothetical protein
MGMGLWGDRLKQKRNAILTFANSWLFPIHQLCAYVLDPRGSAFGIGTNKNIRVDGNQFLRRSHKLRLEYWRPYFAIDD